MQDLLAQILGRQADLLAFDEVRDRLHLRRLVDRGIQQVPLSRIVGTVDRENDFNRAFLPRESSLRERWERVEGLAEGAKGFSPIELYRVGDVDFVVDGHHRVSVARTQGAPSIEASVKEFATPVALPLDTSVQDLVLKEGYVDFLEAIGLAPSSPDEFRVTTPRGYERLLEHISVHRYFRGIETGRPVPWEEAVASWRDAVYRPMVQTIRQSGIMEDFPGQTETDLYLFTMDHLHSLRERYGAAAVGPSRAVQHFRLVREREARSGRIRRWWRRLRGGSRGSP
jgi:hypothetical protein